MKISHSIYLFIMILLQHSFLFSWSMTPTIVTLDPRKPQTFFSITSAKKEKPAAIEITACRRTISENGEEVLTDASKEFVIYPSQITLRENCSKSIRVIWKGDKEKLEEEIAYRIIATSLPVKISTEEKPEESNQIGINLSIATQYLNSLYITPPKAKANVKCSKVYLDELQGGEKRLVIELINHGNAHQYLVDLSFTAENVKEKFNVTKEMIREAYPEGINILAKSQRKLYVQLKNESK